MVVQTLYFGLLALLLIDVAFSFFLSSAIQSIWKQLPVCQAITEGKWLCTDAHEHFFLTRLALVLLEGNFGCWSWYSHLELHCQFASWLGDLRLSILRPSMSVGDPFCSCPLRRDFFAVTHPVTESRCLWCLCLGKAVCSAPNTNPSKRLLQGSHVY